MHDFPSGSATIKGTLQQLRAELSGVVNAGDDWAKRSLHLDNARNYVARLEHLNNPPKPVVDWAVIDVADAIEGVIGNLNPMPNHEDIAELQKIRLWVEAAGNTLNAGLAFPSEWTPSGDSQ